MGSVSTSTSHFAAVPSAPRDEIFELLGAYRRDTHPDRVNLGAGVYCSDAGEPWPLDVVRTVERTMSEKADLHRHDYTPIEGDQQFLALARDFVFGDACDPSRVTSVQTVSGSGANHVGARFLAETLRPRRVWLSAPTWANHELIWATVGVPVHFYPYYNAETRGFDFAAMVDTLEREAEADDVVVLHACAHNPTGLDPSQEQWTALAQLCQRKHLFPFFDNAYQGFASGDPIRDAWAIRHFAQLQPPVEMCVAQSFSKNLGLYGHRAGAFHLVATGDGCTAEAKDAVTANLAQIIRSEYSVSPRYGSDIAKAVLSSKALTAQWHADLQTMSGRILAMRQALFDELVLLGTPGKWVHIVDQVSPRRLFNLSLFQFYCLITKLLDWHVLVHRPHSARGQLSAGKIPHLHALFRAHLYCRLYVPTNRDLFSKSLTNFPQ